MTSPTSKNGWLSLPEIQQLKQKNCWVETTKQEAWDAGQTITPCTWVSRLKRNPAGDIVELKSWICLQGDLMNQDEDNCAPVVAFSTVGFFLVASMILGWVTLSADWAMPPHKQLWRNQSVWPFQEASNASVGQTDACHPNWCPTTQLALGTDPNGKPFDGKQFSCSSTVGVLPCLSNDVGKKKSEPILRVHFTLAQRKQTARAARGQCEHPPLLCARCRFALRKVQVRSARGTRSHRVALRKVQGRSAQGAGSPWAR